MWEQESQSVGYISLCFYFNSLPCSVFFLTSFAIFHLQFVLTLVLFWSTQNRADKMPNLNLKQNKKEIIRKERASESYYTFFMTWESSEMPWDCWDVRLAAGLKFFPPSFKECQLERETAKWKYGTWEFHPKGKEAAHLFIDLSGKHMTLCGNALWSLRCMDAGAPGPIDCEHMLNMEFAGKEFYLQKVFISYMTPNGWNLLPIFFSPSFQERSSGSEESSYIQ